MDYEWLRPAEVLLDPQNPRLPDGTANDKEAINRLLIEGFSQLVALAQDLQERGEANPTELPIVVKDGGKYVVLEGNRRFAALKLLIDPRLADNAIHQAAFERLKKKGKQPPQKIYCAVAKDRDQADHWITLRHTGASDGVGVRVWSAEQTARHRHRMGQAIDSGTVRSIVIADEVTETYQSDAELVDLIKKVRTEKLTNIGRLFSGVTLTRMQIMLKKTGGSSQTLYSKHTANQLHDYFLWAFRFLDEKSVDKFKNDDRRNKLLDEHAELIPSASTAMPEHKRLADYPYSPMTTESDAKATVRNTLDPEVEGEDTDDGAFGVPLVPSSEDGMEQASDDENASIDTSSGSSGRKRDQKEERFLYSMVRVPNLSPTIQRLLKEARTLPIDQYYATTCILARVILELSVSDPNVLKWSGKKESDTLAEKIKGCILRIDPEIDKPRNRKRPDLAQAYHDATSGRVGYLHQFVHNSFAKPSPQLARGFSEVYAPLLNSINKEVK